MYDAIVVGARAIREFDELAPEARSTLESIAADPTWANPYCGLNAETVHSDDFFSATEAR